MITYEQFINSENWPAFDEFKAALTQIVHLQEHRLFLASRTETSEGTTFDVIVMDDYKLVLAKISSNNNEFVESHCNFNVSYRKDITNINIEISELDVMITRAFTEGSISIHFKDGHNIVIDRSRFRLNSHEFKDIVGIITR